METGDLKGDKALPVMGGILTGFSTRNLVEAISSWGTQRAGCRTFLEWVGHEHGGGGKGKINGTVINFSRRKAGKGWESRRAGEKYSVSAREGARILTL